MTGLLDFTAELPVFAVALAGIAAFLLGVGTRKAPGRDGCSNCRTAAAHHQHLAERPAWLGWPGHHAGHLPYGYGDHLDPHRLVPTEKLPRYCATAPTDHELHTWLLTERVLELAGWENPPELYADTLVMEVA